MPCPTCTHTIQTLYQDSHRTIRWCPRCGTLQSVLFGHEEFTVPKLVERHRELIGMVSPGPVGRWLREALHRSGVSESVLPPEERPPAE